MQTRHLITTADERTWPSDRPLLFLGGWCKRWDRQHQWNNYNSILADPYGLGQQSKDENHAYVRALESLLFPELCDLLGRWHGVNSDQRYWRIILGHWFRRYVEVIFNRARTLQSCIAKYPIDSTSVLINPTYSLAVSDSNAAIWASNDDRWNHELYVRLMKLMPDINIRFEDVIDDREEREFRYSTKELIDLRSRVISSLRSVTDKYISELQAVDDVFIINSYLPRIDVLKLHINLGQFPRLPSTNLFAIEIEPNKVLRGELAGEFKATESGDVEHMVRALLFELLPVCYLESFSLIKKKCMHLPWPSKPRAIFTSNNFDTDEVFKSWVADKVLQGSKYIIGQHGNNYGTHRHHFNPSIEEIAADQFLTWGWTDELRQHCPVFMLKRAGRKTDAAVKSAGELLLIENGLPHRLYTWDVYAEHNNYFEDQKCFVSKLAEPSYRQIRVRLSRANEQMGWRELERWREFDSSLKLDDGSEKIDTLIAKSRLVVHSYDSTGMLETLFMNIPTVAFWQNNLEHVRDSARPWYQLLVDVGIVHLSASSAAAHVNNVWPDVDDWWMEAGVQRARAEFCGQFARGIQEPLHILKKILQSELV